MTRKDNSLLRLEAALERIVRGVPRIVDITRKLSIRTVEVEAGLGNGSAYYYPEFIEKTKKIILSHPPLRNPSQVIGSHVTWKEKAEATERVKNKFREENKALKELNSKIAADQYCQLDSLRKSLEKINALEKEIVDLKNEIVTLKRKSISSIK